MTSGPPSVVLDYKHPTGSREYLESTVVPVLREGLVVLIRQWEDERLKLAAGVERDDGQYLPSSWRPFNPFQILGNYILQNKPTGPGEWKGLEKEEVSVPRRVSDSGLAGSSSSLTVTDLVPSIPRWESCDLIVKLEAVYGQYERAQGTSGRIDMTEIVPHLTAIAPPDWSMEDALMMLALQDDDPWQLRVADFVELAYNLCHDLNDEALEAFLRALMAGAQIQGAGGRMGWLRVIFDLLDSDQNGLLIISELRAAALAIDPESADDPARLEATLRYLDKDNSKDQVTSDEFVETMSTLAAAMSSSNTLDNMLLDMCGYHTRVLVHWAETLKSASVITTALTLTPAALAKHVIALPSARLAAHISPADVIAALTEGGSGVVAVDLRTQAEMAVSTLPGAVAMEVFADEGALYGYRLDSTSGVEQLVAAARPDAVVVTFDSTGEKGIPTAILLSRCLGKTVCNLAGGILAYYNAGGEVQTMAGRPVNKLHPGPDLALSMLITRANKFGLDDSSDEEMP